MPARSRRGRPVWHGVGVRTTIALGLSLSSLLLAGAAPAAPGGAAPEALRPVVVRSLPHDPGAFTQGLELDRGRPP